MTSLGENKIKARGSPAVLGNRAPSTRYSGNAQLAEIGFDETGIGADVVRSRCTAPPARDDLIPRQVTADILALSDAHKLVLVSAPAGYGKTTLLAQAHARCSRAAWLSLQGLDGNADKLAVHLIAALMEAGCPGPTWRPREPGDALIDALNGLGSAMYLFLDDLHALRDTPAERLLLRVLQEGGAWLRVIGAARGAALAPLARLRAQGEVAELGVAELAFNETESHTLLQRLCGVSIPLEVVEQAQARIQGWPAGFRLLATAMRRSAHPADVPATFNGRWLELASFFEEEVFAALSAQEQSFVLNISVLKRFTPALCDAVTDSSDGRETLTSLERSGLFLQRLDEEGCWWCYHPLFAEFAEGRLARLPSAVVADWHRRASLWLCENGETEAALDHALRSGDALFGANMLDRCWESINRDGHFSCVVRLADALPPAVLEQFPRVQMWRALYLTVDGRFDEATHLLDLTEKALETQHTQKDAAAARQANELRFMLAHRRMLLALFRGNVAELEQMCASLQESSPWPDPYLQGLTLMALLTARRERYRPQECDALRMRSQELLQVIGHGPAQVWHTCAVAPWLIQRGEVEAAIAHCRQAVELAGRYASGGPAGLELRAMPLALLAQALLEHHELSAAREVFTAAQDCACSIGLVDYPLALYLERARLAFHDDDLRLAGDLLDHAQALAQTRGYERLRWMVAHERVRQALLLADVPGARRAARLAGLAEQEKSLRPGPAATLADEAQALCWARLAVAQGRYAAALRLMRAWADFAQTRGATASAVQATLIAARAQHMDGDVRGAIRSVARALDLAGEGGLTFCFVQEGEPIRSLLVKVLEATSDGASSTLRERLADILNVSVQAVASPAPHQALPAELSEDSQAPSEPLSPREIEILRLLSRGLLYKEIGSRLGLTEGSVKWYMQRIYARLGVRRRLTAIERGRSLGYF